MLLNFTKMHGAGNDFVMLDLVTQRYRLRRRDVRRIADRHFGIGCDQVLVVEPPTRPDVDFYYRIYNADGDEVEQCGNGARCFARFVRARKLTSKRIITAETAAGVLELRVRGNQDVEVAMGEPRFRPDEIPFNAATQQESYALKVNGATFDIGALSMGNPHAVLRVEDVETADVAGLGPAIESHPDFPNRANAGFMQVVSENEIRLRVYERGVGETLACGSGACAAVVYGINRGWLSAPVTVALPGGKLTIAWTPGEQVIMTGPTAEVFEGTIKI